MIRPSERVVFNEYNMLININKIYEAGTFEEYKEGFHAFYRTLDRNKAVSIAEKAKSHLAKIPNIDFNISDEDMTKHLEICKLIDIQFKCLQVIRNSNV